MLKRTTCFFIAMIVMTGMLLGLSSCSQNKDKDKITIGITEYDPMNFRDANGEWTGFDTEFALLVGEKLGVTVEFQLIDWGQKFTELDSGAIDAIWNGFTATATERDGTPRINLCDMSYSYMLNTQSIVVHKDRAGEFTSADSLVGKTLAAEAGSAGEGKANDLATDSGNVIGVPYQINTLIEVMSGAVDGAVIDIILAQELTGRGDYANLVIADIDLGAEVYAIGFRKGDDLRNRVNKAMAELYQDGKLLEIATKYGIQDRLVLDRNFGQ
jgi:polar amino acid transport system substrate-binding protein